MRPYADTNFFARFYLPLPQRGDALALAAGAARMRVEKLPMTWLLEVELTNAIEHCVFVARTGGQFRVTPEAAAAAHAVLADDIARSEFICGTGLAEAAVKQRFRDLALRHTAKQGFRTYDLLHIASALLLNCDTFWSFDVKARALAEAEGLAVNPLSPQ